MDEDFINKEFDLKYPQKDGKYVISEHIKLEKVNQINKCVALYETYPYLLENKLKRIKWENGYLYYLKKLICRTKKKDELNKPDKIYCPLNIASCGIITDIKKTIKCLNLLLDAKADLNNGKIQNPLNTAVIHKQKDVVAFLIDKKANINSNSPLLSALDTYDNKTFDTTRLLIESKADINCTFVGRDKKIYDAFKLICAHNYYYIPSDILSIFLNNKDDFYLENALYEKVLNIRSTGNSVFLRVKKNNDFKMAKKILLDHCKDTIFYEYKENKKLIDFYIETTKTKSTAFSDGILKIIFEVFFFPSANCVNNFRTLLFFSNYEETKYILDSNLNIDINQINHNESALYKSFIKGDINKMKILIDAKADVNLNHSLYGKKTLLNYVYEYKETEYTLDVMKLLLDNKADINTLYHISPINHAIKNKNIKTIELLLEYNCDVTIDTLEILIDNISEEELKKYDLKNKIEKKIPQDIINNIFLMQQSHRFSEKILLYLLTIVKLDEKDDILLGAIKNYYRFNVINNIIENRLYKNPLTMDHILYSIDSPSLEVFKLLLKQDISQLKNKDFSSVLFSKALKNDNYIYMDMLIDNDIDILLLKLFKMYLIIM